MPIAQGYIEGLTKQIFIRDYILNGAFPGQSGVTRTILNKKVPWQFNHQFEYRMLLSTSGTSGTLNSQIFNSNVSLKRPGVLDYGIFRASYGTISDGFNVDLAANLETESAKGAFVTDYAQKVQSMRVNVASSFKNFAIHGRFGVVHRLSATCNSDNIGFTPDATDSWDATGTGAMNPDNWFSITVPTNVYHTGFKKGRMLIKTTDTLPWGAANVNELYMIIDNQPGRLTLVSVPGTSGTPVVPTAWTEGQYLEVAGNRVISNGSYDWEGGLFKGSGTYTSGTSAATGAMEGIADLFPWYIDNLDTAGTRTRNGALALPFRAQPNRSTFTVEQAGQIYFQPVNGSGVPTESIIDSVLNGVLMATGVVPEEDLQVWMNPVTRTAIGYQEQESVRTIREITTAGPVIYQRGVTSTSYQVGSKVIPDVISDFNLPTDVIIIAPKQEISYNCWDNATMEIDRYIKETFSKENTPPPDKLSVPKDFITKLDVANRITYGSPVLGDGYTYGDGVNNGALIVHPSNSLPVAFHEMGALFCEVPFAFVIVKLGRVIVKASDAKQYPPPATTT